MKLQILVNHYKENKDIVQRFLKSLDLQQNVQFETFIISDGGNIYLNDEILNGYSFPIHYAYNSHTGVCHTRNLLLNSSDADYIMFCDIDDMFSSPNGLELLMTAAKETQADIIGSTYNEEFMNLKTNKLEYRVYEKDTLRIHGKIIKRQYLIDNKIFFPDEMETSGDMMFLWLAYSLTNKIVWIKNNFYIWKWHSNSVTRAESFFPVRNFEKTLKCYILLAENLKQRSRLDLYINLICTLFGTIYTEMTHPYWKTAPIELRKNAEQAAKNCLIKYYDDYIEADEEYKRIRYNFMRDYINGKDKCGQFEYMQSWIEKMIFSSDQDILIIGYGNVGHNLEKELIKLQPDIYDKYKNIDNRKLSKQYSIAFICVDTPMTKDNLCDTTEVYKAIMENNADIYVIKSTILPGTIDKLIQETGKHIVFSPEYYGETQHCNNYNFNFTILGGDKQDCIKVQQLLQKVYDGRHQFKITDAKTAELVKYMENSFLATKVSFCQQFFNIAEQIGVNYEELRELFVLDPRVNPSHTFVYRDQPYWDSKCLNKDVAAIANTFNASLLQDIIKFNENQKNK